MLAQKRHQYTEEMGLYREVLGVERALIQQIVQAIEPKYLNGDLTPKDLDEMNTQVKEMTFNPTEPVDTVFTAIDDLAEIAEAAENPLTE